MPSADGDDDDDGGGGGAVAAAVFFSLAILHLISFLHFHSFALYLAGILIQRVRASTEFDNTSEDMLSVYTVRIQYMLYTVMNACARTMKMDGKTPKKKKLRSFSVRIKINFLFCVLCCVVMRCV